VASDHQGTGEHDPDLDNYFGSMSVMDLSLFQMTTGGLDWKVVSDLLMPFLPMAVVVLCVYMAMMSYAVLKKKEGPRKRTPARRGKTEQKALTPTPKVPE